MHCFELDMHGMGARSTPFGTHTYSIKTVGQNDETLCWFVGQMSIGEVFFCQKDVEPD
jgi:hypothetical protein